MIKVYGKDQIRNRPGDSDSPGHPLKQYKGKWTTRMTIEEETSNDQSMREAKLFQERDKFWSKVGMQRY